MQKRFNVVALGELLIDFTPGGISPSGAALFECNPGGAPANVLTAVARQGGKAAFIGKVGDDSFGRLLEKTLEDNKISTDGLRFDRDSRTTLAFVSLDGNGNRSFSFFRNPGADYMLTRSEVDVDLIKSSRVFHFGSLSLTNEPARSATRYALDIAKENHLIISHDLNLRPLLWESQELALNQVKSCLGYVDVLKLSDEEFLFLTGEADFEKYASDFVDRYGLTYLFVTLGYKGAFFYHNSISGIVPAYDVNVVDTTGAGDAFVGAILNKASVLPDATFYHMPEPMLRDLIALANASGSLTSSKRGAIPSIPTMDEIFNCMRTTPLKARN